MRTEEFKEYFKTNELQVNPEYGFIHIVLNNAFYFPGQMVRGRVYVQLCKSIKTLQAILKINGEENVGIPQKQNLKPSPIEKRQTFLDEKNQKNKERKKSVILEVPVINILKAHSDNTSEAASVKNMRVHRPPTKHARSDFVDRADQVLEDWIDRKNSENPSEQKSQFLFRIIEPIFRVKNRELPPGLY